MRSRYFPGFVASICLLLGLLLTACADNTPSPTAVISAATIAPSVTVAAVTATASSSTPAVTATTIAPTLTKGKLREVFPALAKLSDATEFRIRDDWDGLSSIAALIAHYWLERNGNQFEGEAVFDAGAPSSIGGFNPEFRETIREVAIPLDTAQKFLQMLTEIPLEEGQYKPKIDHTDDYPTIEFQIETENGLLRIFNESQDNQPWGASFAGRTFIINSDAPAKAFSALAPYLKKDTLKTLTQNLGTATPKVTPTTTQVSTSTKPSALNQVYNILAQPGHIAGVMAVAFSPDGKFFASASEKGDIRFWDTNGKLLKIFRSYGSGILALAFTSNGKTLVTGESNYSIRFWDVATGKELRAFEQQRGEVLTIIITPNGKTLISANGVFGREIKVWDIASGKTIFTFEGNQIALAPDGKTLAVVSDVSSSLKLYDITTQQSVSSLVGQKFTGPLAFSPDGKTLATVTLGVPKNNDYPIKLFNTADGKELATLSNLAGSLNRLIFSPDGKTLAGVSYRNSELKLWNVNNAIELNSFNNGGRFNSDAAFSPDGKAIVVGGDNIKLWDLTSNVPGGKALFTIEQNTSGVYSISRSPDGKTIATGTDNGDIKLWNAADGKALGTLKGHQSPVNSVVFSPDGKLLASASGNQYRQTSAIKLWDVAGGKELATINGHSEAVWALAFTPDGKYLASGSSDRTVKLWEVSSGKRVGIFKGKVPEFYEFYAIVISPDGKTLAAGGSGDNVSKQYPIKLWDISSGKEIASLKGHASPVRTLAFSSDGKTLASGGDDNFIKLWDSAAGKERTTLPGQATTTSLAFSPDGKILASSHSNGFLKLWEVSSGNEVSNTLAQDFPGKFFIVFSLDGKYLTSGHQEDSALKLWEWKS